jgi:Tol biopolymer transport system component
MPDGSGLLVPLDTLITDRAQIWHIGYPSGAARRFTNDLADYSRQHFDRTADGKMLAIVVESVVSDVSVIEEGPSATSRPLTSGGGARFVTWGNDNLVYYTIGQHIFRRDLNEGAPRQLTAEGTVNLTPAHCGDGSLVYQTFKDDRTEIWRVAADGSSARAIVSADNPVAPSCSPDSTWIAYARRGADQLMAAVRQPMEGGAATELIRNLSRPLISISPEGSLVGARVWDAAGGTSYRVVSANDGAPRYTPPLPQAAQEETFSPDGKAIRYATVRNGAGNLWEQPLTGGPPRQLTSFTDQIIRGFAWSRSGKRLVVSRGRRSDDIVLMTNFK